MHKINLGFLQNSEERAVAKYIVIIKITWLVKMTALNQKNCGLLLRNKNVTTVELPH